MVLFKVYAFISLCIRSLGVIQQLRGQNLAIFCSPHLFQVVNLMPPHRTILRVLKIKRIAMFADEKVCFHNHFLRSLFYVLAQTQRYIT